MQTISKRGADAPGPGLPASSYVSESVWQKECTTVLAQHWTFVQFAHRMSAVGDVWPVTVGDQPILLVHTQDDGIRAYHNVCRHRCLKLVAQPANVGKLIRCPYHAWAYDLSGKLRAAPHFAGRNTQECEGFSLKENGLVPVRTHVWNDWVFVNLSGDAPKFEEYAAPLIRRLEGVDLPNIKPVALLDFGEIKTNWKLIMENFIEPYHVQFVHRTTTDQPLEDHYTVIDGPCLGSAVDLKEELGATGSLGVSSRFLTLFPNFIVGRYFPDQMGVYLNVPNGPGSILQQRVIYTTEGPPLSDKEIEGLRTLWWDVHKEDHEMVERMYEGRASRIAAGGGVLSPVWEDSVRAFQDLIEQDLNSESSRGDTI